MHHHILRRKLFGHHDNRASLTTKIPIVTKIACGGKHNLCLSGDDCVFSWGRGEFGRLGHGDEQHQFHPVLVETLHHKQITDISCGGYHSVALSKSGLVFTWGSGEYGKLGHKDQKDHFVPTLVDAMRGKDVKRILAGVYVTVAYAFPPCHVEQSFLARWASILHDLLQFKFRRAS